jgi:hypothetical protein
MCTPPLCWRTHSLPSGYHVPLTLFCGLAVFLSSVSARCFAQSVNSQSSTDDRHTLYNLWTLQHSAIISGHFDVRFYCYHELKPHSLVRSDLVRLMSSINVSDIDQSLHALRDRFPKPGNEGITYYWGSPLEVYVDQDKVWNALQFTIPRFGPTTEYRVFNGTEELYYCLDTKQADVFPGTSGGLLLTSVDVLRYLPVLNTRTPDLLQVEKRGSRFNVRYGISEIVADDSTGFIYECHRRTREGREVSDTWQYVPVAHPGGIMFPTVRADAAYVDGFCSMLTIHRVVRASINIEVPAARFVLGVPAKTVVVDYRNGRQQPKVRRTSREYGDVLECANEPDSRLQTAIGTDNRFGRNGRTALLLSAVVLVGIVVGLRVWGRRPWGSPGQ